jgi:hypothetical protein
LPSVLGCITIHHLSNVLRSSSKDIRVSPIKSLHLSPGIALSPIDLVASPLEDRGSVGSVMFAIIRTLERNKSLPTRILGRIVAILESGSG